MNKLKLNPVTGLDDPGPVPISRADQKLADKYCLGDGATRRALDGDEPRRRHTVTPAMASVSGRRQTFVYLDGVFDFSWWTKKRYQGRGKHVSTT